ncbi:MAG: hypothetical protein H7201_06660 [Candidatus Saccharibacteria bacterium]|nr:hypothetical protein [Microbacteriaceae bacterium]
MSAAPSRLFLKAVRSEWVLYLVTAVLASLTTVWALKLWRGDLRIPLSYGTDSIGGISGFKTVIETGWYESQPLLNAPHGQVFSDWKIADNLGYFYAKGAALFTSNPSVILNSYYLLGFLLAALAALWFFRLLGVSRALSVVLSVLYSIAPYHFVRGENHLFLSAYFPIPLVLGIAYLILRGRPIWGFSQHYSAWRAKLLSPAVFTFLALAIVATANSYYAVFTVLFIAFAGLIALIRTHDWRRFVGAVVAGVLTVAVMLANMLPDMIYSWINGSNPDAVERVPLAIETYSLKLTQLILPMEGNRFTALSYMRKFYINNFGPQGEGPVLGLVGALGFISLLAIGLYLVVGAAHRKAGTADSERRLSLGALSALTVFAFLISTNGGFSSILTYITSDLRAWNRIAIVISLLSLAAVGIIIDAILHASHGRFLAWTRRVPSRGVVLPVVSAVVALAVLFGGYLDQISPGTAPNYTLTKAVFEQDAALVGRISAVAGKHSSIVQLPYRDYPESPDVNGVSDTDQLKPYIHSSTLSWTGGGVKGRPYSEWIDSLQDLPYRAMTEASAAAGFGGILVDTQAYGDAAAGVIAGLSAELGPPSIVAESDRYYFFLLAPVAKELGDRYTPSQISMIGKSVTNPVLARLIPDVTKSYSGLDLIQAYHPRIMLENDRATSVAVDLVFRATTDVPPRTLRFTAPNGSSVDTTIGLQGATVVLPVVAVAGRSYIDITVVAGPPFPERTRQQATLTPSISITVDTELQKVLGLGGTACLQPTVCTRLDDVSLGQTE